MAHKAPGKSDREGNGTVMKAVVGPFNAKPMRLYHEGADTILGVAINLRVQVLRIGEFASSPQEASLFLAAEAADLLADQLRAAARAARRRAEIGDH